ncbi:MFS transporter [Penicillium lividum]|nr:MFS transporter [Penicillium lividum]
MKESTDLESQKPTPQINSPHDSDTEEAFKPQPPTGYAIQFWRKCLILFVVSWMTLAVTFSSTSLLPAVPEIAEQFSTTSETLDVINAGVLIAMGFSSFIWGPITNLFGRRNAYNTAILFLCACSAGTAASINLHMFIAMRLLSGFTGTYFMVAGQTIIADIFEPVRSVLFLYFGGGRSLIIQDNLHLICPNIQQHLTCGLLATFQYALLTSARSIFDPRFNLTSPLVSGLFYLSPGIGFLIGSVMGGKLSDRAVKNWIVKRGGVRLPQDRLNSGLITLFLVLPIATLIYAWTLEEGVGGMPVPIIAAFFAAVGLLGSFNGLNTYSAGKFHSAVSTLLPKNRLEVMPSIRSEVISGKYVVQYIFAAGATAAVDPLINAIGVGWTFTICVFFAIIGGVNVWIITKWGLDMQRWVEEKFDMDAKPPA